METPIINENFILKKGPEKGAWTFIEMPIMPHLPRKKNSTVRVRGFIDAYEISDFNIWAMKKGTFMAVKADIRKAIKKEEGDSVKLVLYLDEAPVVATDDFMLCLQDEPTILAKFQKLSKTKQKEITDWIFSGKTEDAKVERIAKTMDGIASGKIILA